MSRKHYTDPLHRYAGTLAVRPVTQKVQTHLVTLTPIRHAAVAMLTPTRHAAVAMLEAVQLSMSS